MTINGIDINNWQSTVPFKTRRRVENHLNRPVSQQDMAEWLGYSRPTISMWETGKQTPEPGARLLYLLIHDDPAIIDRLLIMQRSKDDGPSNRSREPSGNPTGDAGHEP